MNLANKLTLARVLLVPIFMIFLLNNNIPYNDIIALIIFVIASLTDTLDGYIARSRNQITKFGKFMDPLADKLLVVAALICFVEADKIGSWMAFIIIAREFIVTGIRILAASDNITIAASKWGKIKTITQMTGIILILLDNFPFSYIGIDMDIIVMYIATIFTVISGYDYYYRNKEIFTNIS
ncbi:MAG: CDP-diacylglycerol--glycerol-3-phosphate 3-phosphatidyltransferase [Andreesenia angusta]|nr:CDP-diacylglycerol--glycerol-3-phosphate 3-phosphatidyltransferase [Andreesenia angusta]